MEQVHFEQFETEIRYHFKNRHFLVEALSHSSYANEKKKCRCSNERLEFLGDSVLSIVVSSYLFHQFPELPEGELTKLRASLVCEKALHVFAQEIHLGDYLLLGKGEEHTGGRMRSSILADAFEAVIAAIYLDGGMEAAEHHICGLFRRIWNSGNRWDSGTIRRHCRKSFRRIRKKKWNMFWCRRAVQTMQRHFRWKSA